jgi:hypothetical protein
VTGVQEVHMVPVATAATAFEAQVIAARLGAEGLLWELRGNVGGPFVIGPVEVLVEADDVASARELLLADEVEAAFDECNPEHDGAEPGRGAVELWVLVTAIALSIVFTVTRLVTMG